MSAPLLGRRGVGRRPAIAVLLVFGLQLMGAAVPNAGMAASGINVQLPTGHRLSGIVTGPGGTPVEGAQVSAQATSGRGAGGALTGADGTYTVRGLFSGTYQVQVTPPRFVNLLGRWFGAPTSQQDPAGAADVSVAGDVSGIDVQLEGGLRLAGTVTGVSGHPVQGIQVNAGSPSGAGSAEVAGDGSYEIVGLYAGTYTVSIYTPSNSDYRAGAMADGAIVPGFEPGTPVDLAEGDALAVDFTVAIGFAISGRVTGGDGPVEVDANAAQNFGGTIAGADGTFTVHGLWPDTYRIVFTHASDPAQPDVGGFPYGGYGAGGALVDQGAAIPIDVSGDVALDPVAIPAGAAMTGSVRGDGVPLANAYVFMCDPNVGCVSTFTGADGTYRIGHFLTGDWLVQAFAAHRVSGYYGPGGYSPDAAGATSVHVDAAGPDVTGIDLSLPAGGSISGRVTGPSGEPVAGSHLAVTGVGVPPGAMPCITQADGTFICDGIGAGFHTLFVNAPEGSDYLSGYYDANVASGYTPDFNQATPIEVTESNDVTPPTVSTSQPAPESTNVPRDAVVAVRFSEGVVGVDRKSMSLRDAGGATVVAAVTYDRPSRTATLVPKTLLKTSTAYRLSLTSAIRDAAGNALASISWTFTTTPDGSAPRVVERFPGPGDRHVPTTTAIRATFSEDVRNVSADSFRVVDATGAAVAGSISYDPGTFQAVFSTFGLASNASYAIQLTADIRDLAGNPLKPVTWSFQTGD